MLKAMASAAPVLRPGPVSVSTWTWVSSPAATARSRIVRQGEGRRGRVERRGPALAERYITPRMSAITTPGNQWTPRPAAAGRPTDWRARVGRAAASRGFPPSSCRRGGPAGGLRARWSPGGHGSAVQGEGCPASAPIRSRVNSAIAGGAQQARRADHGRWFAHRCSRFVGVQPGDLDAGRSPISRVRATSRTRAGLEPVTTPATSGVASSGPRAAAARPAALTISRRGAVGAGELAAEEPAADGRDHLVGAGAGPDRVPDHPRRLSPVACHHGERPGQLVFLIPAQAVQEGGPLVVDDGLQLVEEVSSRPTNPVGADSAGAPARPGNRRSRRR